MHEKAKKLDTSLRSVLADVVTAGEMRTEHRQRIRKAFVDADWQLPEEYSRVIESDSVDDEVYWSVLSTIGEDVSLLASDLGRQIDNYEQRKLDGTLERWLLTARIPDDFGPED
jgi:hypothetical protein